MFLILTICHVHSAVAQGEGRLPEYGGECICSGHDLKNLSECLHRVICMTTLPVSSLFLSSVRVEHVKHCFMCVFVYFSFSHKQMAPQLTYSHLLQHMRTLQMWARRERRRHHRLPLKLGALYMCPLLR